MCIECQNVWANYKVDDSKEAVITELVSEDVDEDCVPIGMAFDINNTSTIPALAPYDSDINPVPALAIISKTRVLSFRLVNNHDIALCSISRAVGPVRLCVMEGRLPRVRYYQCSPSAPKYIF